MKRPNDMLAPVLVLSAVFAAGNVCGCHSRGRDGSAGRSATKPARTPATIGGGDLEDRYVAFARKIEAGMNVGDAEVIDGNFHVQAFLSRALRGAELSPRMEDILRTRVRQDYSLGKTLIQELAKGGSLKLLRVRRVGDEVRALYRLTATGLAYYEIILCTDDDGHVKVADIYPFLIGECMSKSLLRTLAPALVDIERDAERGMSIDQMESLADMAKFAEVAKLLDAGRAREALKRYSDLPPRLRKDRAVMMLRLRATQALGTDSKEYLQTLKDIARADPDNPCLPLVLTEMNAAQRNYVEALEHLDRLEQLTGPDAYLCFIRANMLILVGQHERARKEAERGMRIEPTLIRCYWALADATKAQKDWAGACRALTRIEKQFPDVGINIQGIEQDPEFAEFVVSKAYRKWKAGRKTPASRPGAATSRASTRPRRY